VLQQDDGVGAPLAANQLTSNDDLLQTWMGIGSQIDGLGHLGINHRYYNGKHASEFVTVTGLTSFGIESLPPIVTRGVLINMASHLRHEILDAMPGEQPDEMFPAHQELLARHGVYILENMDTRELAADGATEFLFVLGQPRLVGAVQAIINPVAIR